MKIRHTLLGTLTLLATPVAFAQTANVEASSKPPVVALMAAIGDHIDIVREHMSTGSHLEPYSRQTVPMQSQALNYAVLRGLDRAVADAEPRAQRVLLQWTIPATVYDAVENAAGSQREQMVLDEVIKDLRSRPDRQEWDRIEVIVPSYRSFGAGQGMGTKLSGVGVYVQPLNNVDLAISPSVIPGAGDAAVEVSSRPGEGEYHTQDPNDGAKGKSTMFVAPYMYFDLVTLDARTLAVTSRKPMFEETKYFDPKSNALDVGRQMNLAQIVGKVVETVEQASYKSVRDVHTEVRTTTPVEQPKPSTAGASTGT